MSTLTILENGKKTDLSFASEENLLTFLRAHGYFVDAPCGGNGTCGKCRVLLRVGETNQTVSACQTTLTQDCTVTLPQRTADLSWNDSAGALSFAPGRTGLGAAIDLGTTTIAVKLYSLTGGLYLGTETAWNVQKAFGADIISRIGCCIERADGLALLGDAVRGQVREMLQTLCRRSGRFYREISEIFLAGNTVMQHIFAGFSPVSIASAPFTPLSLFDGGAPYDFDGIPVYLSPCVAGYVGGDITAGLLSTKLREKNGRSLFLDVGTNGEMALGGQDGFVCCAVASGPAFEGAGIECGMSASFGAIHKVELTDGGLSYEVLGGGEAEGICGSGLLDLVACLLDLGYLDEGGCLAEDEHGEAVFYLTDKVYITQKDVRQLQLAKAAVSAGIQRLMRLERVTFADIDALYLAGGFGNRLNPASAVRIGMLPREIKTVPCGNSALSGAETALLDPAARDTLREIQKNCRYLELSSDAAFNDLFIEEMSFPEDDIP